MSELLRRHFGPFTRYDTWLSVVVFVVYFLTAKGAFYVYYHFHTSPALIWPPVGIALAAVIMGGYRMWAPIFLAQFLCMFIYAPQYYASDLVIATAYALQAIVSLFMLRRFKFEPALDSLHKVLAIIAVGFFATMIEPAIATAFQILTNPSAASPLLSFGRAWGAGIFSVLVITPFILSWYPFKPFEYERNEFFEGGAAFALLILTNFFLFWTPYAGVVGIAIIFFLPAVLIWFALRLRFRWLTLALIVTSVEAIAGSIMAHASATSVNAQLLPDQIYIGLVAAIFLVFVAIVEERRSAYERLQEAYENTFASDKAKSEFIAILAHELRNPLAPIVSALELLRLEPQTPRALTTIGNAEEHTMMIRRLLDDLLDTARLAQKKFKLQKEVAEARDLIEQSVASVQDFLEGRRHRLRVALKDEHTMLLVDPVRVKQIIINLLNNAGKYTPPGGDILLHAQRSGDDWHVRIADNGIGIAPEMRESIFQPFKQLDSARGTSAGLGIGLYLTKRLVEMHKGRIEVADNTEGKGTVFDVFLPIPARVPLPGIQKKRGPRRADGAHVILVVDDNKPAADTLAELLKHRGQKVEKSYSGEDALSRLAHIEPDVILLDIGMPSMDGYAVAQKLRARNWNGILIAVTGYGQESDRERVKQAGFDRHLVKPVAVEDVTDAIAAGHATAPV